MYAYTTNEPNYTYRWLNMHLHSTDRVAAAITSGSDSGERYRYICTYIHACMLKNAIPRESLPPCLHTRQTPLQFSHRAQTQKIDIAEDRPGYLKGIRVRSGEFEEGTWGWRTLPCDSTGAEIAVCMCV
jgi:hypothetical protein